MIGGAGMARRVAHGPIEQFTVALRVWAFELPYHFALIIRAAIWPIRVPSKPYDQRHHSERSFHRSFDAR